MVEESDYIRPPTLTPEEEAEEERKAVKLNRLKKQPTFQNEKKGQLALDGLGLGGECGLEGWRGGRQRVQCL